MKVEKEGLVSEWVKELGALEQQLLLLPDAAQIQTPLARVALPLPLLALN